MGLANRGGAHAADDSWGLHRRLAALDVHGGSRSFFRQVLQRYVYGDARARSWVGSVARDLPNVTSLQCSGRAVFPVRKTDSFPVFDRACECITQELARAEDSTQHGNSCCALLALLESCPLRTARHFEPQGRGKPLVNRTTD